MCKFHFNHNKIVWGIYLQLVILLSYYQSWTCVLSINTDHSYTQSCSYILNSNKVTLNPDLLYQVPDLVRRVCIPYKDLDSEHSYTQSRTDLRDPEHTKTQSRTYILNPDLLFSQYTLRKNNIHLNYILSHSFIYISRITH